MDADGAPKSEIVPGSDTEGKQDPEIPEATDAAVTEVAVTEGAVTDGAVTEGAETDGAVTEGAITDGAVTENVVENTAEVEKTSDDTKPSSPMEKEGKEDTEGERVPEDIKPDPEGNKINPEDKEPNSKDAHPETVTPECLAKTDDGNPPETEVPAIAAIDPFSDTNPSPEPAPPVSQHDTKTDPSPEPREPAASPGPAPAPAPHVHRSAHHSRAGAYASLTLNQMAIAASAQNKLPTSRLKGILERLGRHTESSAKKRGAWYKSETSYVDVNSYSWKNLALYKDYQQNMWTGDGTIKSTCKK
ncbi:brain acid soluble protein 1-like [Haliotis cracherodii]|uniref:brain acid soluble protein 1-like n=1 Tax=Haliotis cracherodii TaxID=6455 RepID=UPI0039EAA012